MYNNCSLLYVAENKLVAVVILYISTNCGWATQPNYCGNQSPDLPV